MIYQFAAFAVYFLYFSFFEWAFHRYMFHTPRFSRYMFKEHTLTHHQIYKGDDSYHTHDDHPHKVPMDWWAIARDATRTPAALFLLVQWATGLTEHLGAALLPLPRISAFMRAIHWAMHVPRAANFANRFRVFRFLDTHHRVHHKYMLSNLECCVATRRPVPRNPARRGWQARSNLFGSAKKPKAAKPEAETSCFPA